MTDHFFLGRNFLAWTTQALCTVYLWMILPQVPHFTHGHTNSEVFPAAIPLIYIDLLLGWYCINFKITTEHYYILRLILLGYEGLDCSIKTKGTVLWMEALAFDRNTETQQTSFCQHYIASWWLENWIKECRELTDYSWQ